MDYKLLIILFLIGTIPLFTGVMAVDFTIQKDGAADDLLNYTVYTNSYGVDQFWVDENGFVYSNGTLVTGGTVLSIHNIGNVTSIGCAEDQFLKVNSTGFFACADGSGADNLGNHIATQDLNMSNNNIYLNATQLICFDGVTCYSNISEASDNILTFETADAADPDGFKFIGTRLNLSSDADIIGHPDLRITRNAASASGRGPNLTFMVHNDATPTEELIRAFIINPGLITVTDGAEDSAIDFHGFSGGTDYVWMAFRGDFSNTGAIVPSNTATHDMGTSSLAYRDYWIGRDILMAQGNELRFDSSTSGDTYIKSPAADVVDIIGNNLVLFRGRGDGASGVNIRASDTALADGLVAPNTCTFYLDTAADDLYVKCKENDSSVWSKKLTP